MASTAKSIFKALSQQLQKEFKAGVAVMPNDREVLVQLVYSAFLENTPASVALEAFEIIENSFIDWNELRVSTTRELVEMLPKTLGNSRNSCERVRQTLQTIFQKTYNFDLEEWRDKGEQAFREFLESIPFTTHFMVNYLIRTLFGGSVFPLDEGAMRVFRLLDLVDVDSENREVVRGLEKAVPKDGIVLFAQQVHELGAILYSSDPTRALEILKAVDPLSAERSFIPLVDVEEEDPHQIARRLENQRQRSMKMSFADDMDSDDDDFIENTESLEEQTPYENEEYGEEDVSGCGNSENVSKKDSEKVKEKPVKESKVKKVKEQKPVKEPKVPKEAPKTSAAGKKEKELKEAAKENAGVSKTRKTSSAASEAKEVKETKGKSADSVPAKKAEEKKSAAKKPSHSEPVKESKNGKGIKGEKETAVSAPAAKSAGKVKSVKPASKSSASDKEDSPKKSKKK